MVSHWFWQQIGVESLAASAALLSAGGFGECLQLQLCPHMRANQECGGALQSPLANKQARMEEGRDASGRGREDFFRNQNKRGKGRGGRVRTLVESVC